MEEHKDSQDRMKVLIITGMSGAGKTQAIMALEDIGYFCVDNLPANVFMKFVETLQISDGSISRVALVMDARGGEFFSMLGEILSQLKEIADSQIVFLDAADEVLMRRYKETRRKHPLAKEGDNVLSAIKKERELLKVLRDSADLVIDTSLFTAHQLKDQIIDTYSSYKGESMTIYLSSFGYKYGLPTDADLVVDVRFLPNPYYDEKLRHLTGQDKKVYDYVFSHQVTEEFVSRYLSLLTFLLPHYIKEGKRYLSIAVGCTGGRHRSVAIAGELAKRLLDAGYYPNLHHRDIDKADHDKA